MTDLFDSHVNLHADVYDDDRSEVIKRARDAGVTRFIAICDKLENFSKIRSMAKTNTAMWCSVGAHPHYAKDHQKLKAEDLVERSSDSKVVGIGETGLDFHYTYSPPEDQERCFTEHILASQETGLPLIVHTREADELTGDILEREFKKKAFPILMHCYTSGEGLAQRAAEWNAYFSVSGIMTFKKAKDVRDVILKMPIDRTILETDCPYLAPVPHRGRRNEPSYLIEVCKAYAELRGLSFEEAAHATTRNCLQLFSKAS